MVWLYGENGGGKDSMELERAKAIADMVTESLMPACEKIQVAGSIRRRRPFVHDCDLVCLPSNQGQFITRLQGLGKFKLGGSKVIRVARPDLELDIYIATPATWATLLLIRTGSARHNVMLCSLAKSKGMKLHADGSGLFRVTSGGEERIAGDTERSIFEALGLPYKPPEDREV